MQMCCLCSSIFYVPFALSSVLYQTCNSFLYVLLRNQESWKQWDCAVTAAKISVLQSNAYYCMQLYGFTFDQTKLGICALQVSGQ